MTLNVTLSGFFHPCKLTVYSTFYLYFLINPDDGRESD